MADSSGSRIISVRPRRKCVLWTTIWPTPSARTPTRGFDKAAVVVMDGRGAWEASSIWYGHDGRLDHVLTIPWPNSLGLFYAQFTQYLGFVPNSDEWKVMGLAPYGSPGVNLERIHLAKSRDLSRQCAASF